MQHEGKKEKKTIQTLASAVSPCHISATRAREGISVSVYGVSSILEFSEESVLLDVSFSQLKICGERLNLTVYEEGRVEIVGKIRSTEFLYGKA